MRYEMLSRNKKIMFLQRLHNKINSEIFNGELATVKIDIVNTSHILPEPNFAMFCNRALWDGTREETIFISYEGEDCVSQKATQKEQAFFLTALLLHEMIHQYCFENGIDDADHGEAWQRVAAEHELISVYENGEPVSETMGGVACIIAMATKIR